MWFPLQGLLLGSIPVMIVAYVVQYSVTDYKTGKEAEPSFFSTGLWVQ